MSIILAGQRPLSVRRERPLSPGPAPRHQRQTAEFWNDVVAILSLLVVTGIVAFLIFRP